MCGEELGDPSTGATHHADQARRRLRRMVQAVEDEAGWQQALWCVVAELEALPGVAHCQVKVVEHSGLLRSLPRCPAGGMSPPDPSGHHGRDQIEVAFAGGVICLTGRAGVSFGDEDRLAYGGVASVLDEASKRVGDPGLLAPQANRPGQDRRLETMGRMTAGIAHNFGNVLQAVSTNLGVAMARSPDQLRPFLQEAEDAVGRAADLVQQLMCYAKGEKDCAAIRPLDLKALVQGVVSLYSRTFGGHIEMRVDLPDSLPQIQGNAGDLEQVLLNLYLNARDALEERPRPSPWVKTSAQCVQRLHPATGNRGEYLQLQVADNGAGMEEATRRRLFEPFFSTKKTGQGTGLGLATAQAVIEYHGGWIECQSTVGIGTTFSLFLPLAIPAPHPTGQEEAAFSGAQTVLLVDDDPYIRRGLSEVLGTLGYRVLEAEDGPQALEIASARHGQIGLVLLDLSLPGLPGRAVLRQLHQNEPQLKLVICTGQMASQADFGEEVAAVIRKPFSLRLLAQTLDQVLRERH